MIFNLYLILSILFFILFLIMLILYMKQKESSNASFFLLQSKYNDAQKSKSELELKYAVLHARYEDEIQASQEKLSLLQNTKDELSREFKLLSNKIFDDKAKQFSNTSRDQLELLLKPFREQITHFSSQAKEQFQTQTKETILLKDELLRLKNMNEQLSQDALNLTNALKGENKTQGNWGEFVLEKILEQSGLRQGKEYEIQESLKSDEGKLYRPDVVIHMPQNRDIVVDSKVSLVAYERFINSDDATLKANALKEHIKSINAHIKELSEKEYNKLVGLNSLDFVLLFMPIEGAFLLALEQDGEFFKNAYEKNILVVSPSTLLVTLRTIEHIWRTQRQEEHALKIASEAEAMYDKLVGFVEELKKVGAHLQKAGESYDTAMNRLQSGRGNVIKRAENIVKLGIKPKKELSIKSEDSL